MLRGIIARNQFEQELVDTIEQADKSVHDVEDAFNNSCMLCTMYGRDADCRACPIREAAIAKMKWHGTPTAYEWVEKESILE